MAWVNFWQNDRLPVLFGIESVRSKVGFDREFIRSKPNVSSVEAKVLRAREVSDDKNGDPGCLPFTWRNRLVDGLCKWKAKFPYWKFPFGVACTIWTTDPTYRKSLGRLWHLQNGGWNHCIQRDYRCFNWRVITSRSFSIMRKMENST